MMIYLGYDIMRQVCIARYQDATIVCEDSDRAAEILNGLCDVAEDLPRAQDAQGEVDGVEVVIVSHTPWMKAVQYSDQAWNDLLSVGVIQ